MRIRMAGVMLICCLLLAGCAPILNREYGVVELHSGKYWESDADDILRAESYQDVVNDLLLLIADHTEQATLRLYVESGELAVTELVERAAAEVQKETPLGAYAVEYITTELQTQRGYYEISVRIGYRRTKEQMKAIVNATSTAALEDLLDAAMESGRRELAVRISYWSEEDELRVAETLQKVMKERKMSALWVWTPQYYPNASEAGLIEFRKELAVLIPTKPAEPDPGPGDQPGEGTEPGESTEEPGEGAEPGEPGETGAAEGENPAGGENGPAEEESVTVPDDGGTEEADGSPKKKT